MPDNSIGRIDGSAAAQQRFLSLFLRSERGIFRYVAALVPNLADADDIVQQTAVALWEKFDAYDPSQPFTPWACRFALNKVRQWMERRRRWQALLENGLAEELAQRREELRPELEIRLQHLEGCLNPMLRCGTAVTFDRQPPNPMPRQRNQIRIQTNPTAVANNSRNRIPSFSIQFNHTCNEKPAHPNRLCLPVRWPALPGPG
jgi:RNA polymerase sigma factor (sigma-70 family)